MTFDPAGVHLSVCSEDKVWAAHRASKADHWGHQSGDGRHQHRLCRQKVRKTNSFPPTQKDSTFSRVTECVWLTFDRICCLEEREDQRDRLDFVRGQINRLTDNVKERIRTLTDDVAAKVRQSSSPRFTHTHTHTHLPTDHHHGCLCDRSSSRSNACLSIQSPHRVQWGTDRFTLLTGPSVYQRVKNSV